MSAINKIGVIGAGNMGSGIAQKIIQEGIPVVMVDTTEAFVQKGVTTIKQMLAQGVERNIFTERQVEEILGRLTATTDMNQVADADLVIEAVFEDKAVKTDVFKKLDAICEPKTILATNTSSYYVKENWSLEGEVDESRIRPVIDRLYGVCLGVAAALVDEGVASIEDTDRGAKIGLRWILGPFEIMNTIGIAATCDLVEAIAAKYPDFKTPPLLMQQKDKGSPFAFQSSIRKVGE